MREKLIELIGQVQDCGCDVTDVVEMNYVDNNVLATHIIANGVTIQEWIPVTERLPCKEGGQVLLARMYRGKRYVEIGEILSDGTACSYSDDYKIHPKEHIVTHWMPLPTPPKGE